MMNKINNLSGKQKIGVLSVFVLLMLLGIVLTAVPKRQEIRPRAAGSGEVDVRFDPSSGTKAKNDTFKVDLKLYKSAARSINASGAQAVINIDSKFTINSATCEATFSGLPVANINGQTVTFICGIALGTNPVALDAAGKSFASVNVTVKNNAADGAAPVTFSTTRVTEAGVPSQAPDVSTGGQNASFTVTSSASVCVPQNKIINITPVGGPGTCHDLQKAIDAVNSTGFTIRFAPGKYTIPESGSTFSINITNKRSLTIEGDKSQDSSAVKLEFNNNRGGITVENSTNINIGWMEITGKTSNGLISISKDSSDFNLSYGSIYDSGAHTMDIQGGSDFTIVNTTIKSMAGGLDIGGSRNVKILNSILQSNNIALQINDSSGEIKFNRIMDNLEHALIFVGSNTFNIEENTIVKNHTSDPSKKAAIHIEYPVAGSTKFSFKKNIVAFNEGPGVEIRDSGKVDYSFEHNDFYKNGGSNYIGIADPTGTNGNIASDPLFNEINGYCLLEGSPAIYGNPANGEYIGHRGPCSTSPSSCLPFPTTDTFEGASINTDLWSDYKLGGNQNSRVTQASGVLNARVESDGTQNDNYMGVKSNKKLCGDFDVRVDFSQFSHGNGVDSNVYLSIQNGNDNNMLFLSINNSANSQVFSTNIRLNGIWGPGTTSPTPVTTGKMRIKRRGTIISTFYDQGNGNGWQLLKDHINGFVDDVDVILNVGSRKPDKPFSSVNFDNFYLSAVQPDPTFTPVPSATPTPSVSPTPTPPSGEDKYTIDVGDKQYLVFNIAAGQTPQIRYKAKLANVQNNPQLYFKLRVRDELAFMKSSSSGSGGDSCNNPPEGSKDFNIPSQADGDVYKPVSDVNGPPPAGAKAATVSIDGWVSLDGVIPGRYYTLLLKGPKTRSVKVAEHVLLQPNQNTQIQDFDWSNKPLDPGDLPDPNNGLKQDCTVNSVDLSLITSRLGATDGDSLNIGDVNYDGIINGNDVSKVVNTLSTKPDDDL